MGGIYFTWRLTPGADGQYLHAPSRVGYGRRKRRRIPVGIVSKAAVVAEAGTNVPAALPWVVFSCDGRRFGVPLNCVSEILTPRPFTRLPGAGPEVCGLVGMRGRVMTVLDLGIVLGLRSAASLPDHRLLLVDLGARRIGAAVEEVVDIAPARIEQESGAAGVLGTGYLMEAAFTALDPKGLFEGLLPG